MSNGPVFNVNNQGQIGQQNIGQSGGEAKADIHFGASQVTLDEFFGAIGESVPAEYATDVVEPLKALAAMPAEEQEKPEAKSKATQLMAKLTPYAPAFGKAVLAFGEASLTALATSNPVVSGILAVVKSLRAKEESKDEID